MKIYDIEETERYYFFKSLYNGCMGEMRTEKKEAIADGEKHQEAIEWFADRIRG